MKFFLYGSVWFVCVLVLYEPITVQAGRTWKRWFLGKDDSCDRTVAIYIQLFIDAETLYIIILNKISVLYEYITKLTKKGLLKINKIACIKGAEGLIFL